MKRSAWLLAGILITGGATAAFVVHAWQQLDRPVDVPAPVRVVVPPGTRIGAVATVLESKQLLREPRNWVWYAKFRGIAGHIKAGTYEFGPGATPRGILQDIVAGRVLVSHFTIVDGWTVRDLLAALHRSADIAHSPRILDPDDLMALLGEQPGPPEGQFLPDTYSINTGTHDLELLRIAHQGLVKARDAAWADREADLPLRSPQELLTLASIVEKETALGSERPKIAGVYLKRLRIGMRLQADPTVIYGLGVRYDGDLRLADLRADGPFNTYTRAGLPPTPIALAGLPALQAVAHPDMTGALYFVASGIGDGSHVFSKNLTEHNAAVARLVARQRAIARRAVAEPR